MANIRRLAGRMLRQKRRPGKKIEEDKVFDPWVRDINEYLTDSEGIRFLRIKYPEDGSEDRRR
jgi:hypothetical protein